MAAVPAGVRGQYACSAGDFPPIWSHFVKKWPPQVSDFRVVAGPHPRHATPGSLPIGGQHRYAGGVAEHSPASRSRMQGLGDREEINPGEFSQGAADGRRGKVLWINIVDRRSDWRLVCGATIGKPLRGLFRIWFNSRHALRDTELRWVTPPAFGVRFAERKGARTKEGLVARSHQP
jgi:hypothetical protein